MRLEDFLLTERERRLVSTPGRDLPFEQEVAGKPTQARRTSARKPTTPEEVARWKQLRAEGLSDKRIAAQVGRAQSTISRLLGNAGRVEPKLSTDAKAIRSRNWWRAHRAKAATQ